MEDITNLIRRGMEEVLGEPKIKKRIYTVTERSRKLKKRVLALLEVPCLTYQEIGDRVGVTRERVRQIAKANIEEFNGRERRAVCAVGTNRSKILSLPRIQNLIARCDKYNLSFDLIPVNGTEVQFKRAEILINGYNCGIRTFTRDNNGYYRLFRKKTRGQHDFILGWYEPEDIWLIIPEDKVPTTGTSFVLEPNIDYPGGKYHRHDYPLYKEAWNLLKTPSDAFSESEHSTTPPEE